MLKKLMTPRGNWISKCLSISKSSPTPRWPDGHHQLLILSAANTRAFTPALTDTDRPELIAIDHDDYHAQHIGSTADGNQFFLTTPFEPATNDNDGCEYVALFIFDPNGNNIGSEIEVLGPRSDLIKENAEKAYQAKLLSLGQVTFKRIEVKPFGVSHNGVEFGLIAREPEDEEDLWAVELQPGNYMAFFEPWDSGDYDT